MGGGVQEVHPQDTTQQLLSRNGMDGHTHLLTLFPSLYRKIPVPSMAGPRNTLISEDTGHRGECDETNVAQMPPMHYMPSNLSTKMVHF